MAHLILWAQYNRSVNGFKLKKGWCRKEDSNLRPTHYECVALPTELFRRNLRINAAPAVNNGRSIRVRGGYHNTGVCGLPVIARLEGGECQAAGLGLTYPNDDFHILDGSEFGWGGDFFEFELLGIDVIQGAGIDVIKMMMMPCVGVVQNTG